MATRVRGVTASRPARARRPAAASARARAQVSDIQRARLLAGAVRALDEQGYAHTTVSHITERARVSRRTFYELFSDREDCLLAVIDGAVERVRAKIANAGLVGQPWRERMRGGVELILSFLDHDPALARVCVVQSSGAGQRVLERRAQILSELAGAIDEGRLEGVRRGDCTPLIAEGLAGATLSILYARLSRREGELPAIAASTLKGAGELSELAGELTSMIVLPYQGPAAARRERERPALLAPSPVWYGAVAAGDAWANGDAAQGAPSDGGAGESGPAGEDPLSRIPMRLTYRTARVLETIAERPGICNRELAELAGMTDQGQTSKLLARLERFRLLENTGVGHTKGEPNAWRLTVAGRSVTQTIAQGARYRMGVEQADV